MESTSPTTAALSILWDVIKSHTRSWLTACHASPATPGPEPEGVAESGERGGVGYDSSERARPTRERVPEHRPTVNLLLMAKYPWLEEARMFAEGFGSGDLPDAAYKRAVERVREAMAKGEHGVSFKAEDVLAEVLSFPTARALCIIVDDVWLKKRWASAEAARCERLMHAEEEDTLRFLISRSPLKACAADIAERRYGEFKMHIADYLSSAKDLLTDPAWKLVNQVVDGGYVYLDRARTVRLLGQAVYRRFLEGLMGARPVDVRPEGLPESFMRAAESIKRIVAKRRPKRRHPSDSDAWPPCMAAILQRVKDGEDVAHVEKFSLAAFMLARGFTVEEVLGLFSGRADFDERTARYQVEHIAGLRGSRTKYLPPSCEKMRSLGMCVDGGVRCAGKIRNPVQYHE